MTIINPSNICNMLDHENLTIFLFHGVIKHQEHLLRNYTNKHINVELFESYLSKLSAYGKPLSMDEVLSRIESRESFSPGSFAITFDDGFENNLSVAAPVMEKYKVPFMIYLTTGFVEHNRMSWIDRIEDAVEITNKTKIRVEEINSSYSITEIDEKINFLNEIRRYVKNTPSCNAELFSEKLCDDLVGSRAKIESDDPLDLKISWDQVVKASQENELISFGGHSHNHSILSFLSHDNLKNELDQSIFLLKNKGRINLKHYSYPEGLSHCYSDFVIDELKIRGIRCCPTAISGNNSINSDPFRLNRIMVS
jgi:peptidoglycan/xylan/chitin deacetylase (PgdA/CDA1 family)